MKGIRDKGGLVMENSHFKPTVPKERKGLIFKMQFDQVCGN